MDGLVVIDKPAGLTSQAVVSRCRRALGERKAGHGGTLDPMATGVLLVGLGKATRLLGYLAADRKTYRATIRLGQAMTTDDAEGEPVGESVDATGVDDAALEAAISAYRGPISQVPSSVSAIKVNGKRAYALVRAGQDVELKPRAVTIHRYDVLARRDCAPFVDLDVEVDCSSGTYIRALARDLGNDLGVGGHLTALRRTQVGAFAVADAVPLDEVAPADVIDTSE
ncbi:MAG: tRNA pseudouridine(55) synthase TruB, partial [Propionibacteriaceae bacterium]|nr:tRNA pseudouridine(55) synthase TruB [Propionibacteriaceae bacterium]